jgi:hypothetical protein
MSNESVKESSFVDTKFLDIEQLKKASEQLASVIYFYPTYKSLITALCSIYNNAEKVVNLMNELDYSSLDSLGRAIDSKFNRYQIDKIEQLNIETDDEFKFWTSAHKNFANNKNSDSLNVFFWIDTIKAKKSAEYEAAIDSQDILEALKTIIQLKQQIIDEALADVAQKDAFSDLIKKYNLGLDLIEKVKGVLKEVKTSDDLPDIKFKMTQSGNVDPKGAWIFKKLPAGDLKGLFLGYESNSCQSVGKPGEICAINGFTRTDAGFYVLQNQTGKIKGQFYAWLAEDGSLVLDSHESCPEDKKLLIPILTAMKAQLGNKNLYLGVGGGTSKLSFEIFGRPKATGDLAHYRDSNNVYKIEGEVKLLENQNSSLDLDLDKVIQIVDLLNQCKVSIDFTPEVIELIVKVPSLLKYENLIEMFSTRGRNKWVEFIRQKLISYSEEEIQKFIESHQNKTVDELACEFRVQFEGQSICSKFGNQIPALASHPKLVEVFVNYGYDKAVTENLMSLTKSLLESNQEELYKIIELGSFNSLIHNPKLVECIIQSPQVASHPKLVEVFANYSNKQEVTENLMKLTKGLLESNQEELYKIIELGSFNSLIHNSKLVDFIIQSPELRNYPEVVKRFADYSNKQEVTENLMKLTKGLLESHQEKFNNFVSFEGSGLILCNSQLVELIVKFPLLLEHHQLTECFARFWANKPIQVAMDQIKGYSEEGLTEFIQSHIGEAEVLYSKLCDEYRDVPLAGELQF